MILIISSLLYALISPVYCLLIVLYFLIAFCKAITCVGVLIYLVSLGVVTNCWLKILFSIKSMGIMKCILKGIRISGQIKLEAISSFDPIMIFFIVLANFIKHLRIIGIQLNILFIQTHHSFSLIFILSIWLSK